MTEAEWLACTEPLRMLEFLGDRGGDRKLRLFACACVRRVWHLLVDQRSREAVELAERFADGGASPETLADARPGADAVWRNLSKETEVIAAQEAWGCTEGKAIEAAHYAVLEPTIRTASTDAVLLCEVIGNPFRPATFDSSRLTPTITSLAQAAYDERRLPSGELDPVRLAVLADAIEEANCADEAILAHFREPGPHVRGCAALDLIPGKE